MLTRMSTFASGCWRWRAEPSSSLSMRDSARARVGPLLQAPADPILTPELGRRLKARFAKSYGSAVSRESTSIVPLASDQAVELPLPDAHPIVVSYDLGDAISLNDLIGETTGVAVLVEANGQAFAPDAASADRFAKTYTLNAARIDCAWGEHVDELAVGARPTPRAGADIRTFEFNARPLIAPLLVETGRRECRRPLFHTPFRRDHCRRSLGADHPTDALRLEISLPKLPGRARRCPAPRPLAWRRSHTPPPPFNRRAGVWRGLSVPLPRSPLPRRVGTGGRAAARRRRLPTGHDRSLASCPTCPHRSTYQRANTPLSMSPSRMDPVWSRMARAPISISASMVSAWMREAKSPSRFDATG